MGWTAGADRSTGDLITAANWNNYLGTSGSLEYLQSWSINDVTASRSLGTAYQNTKDFIMIVIVTVTSGGSNDHATAYSGSVSPGSIVGKTNKSTSGEEVAITFVVLPNHYYKVQGSGSETLTRWVEWAPA